jgi:hypothetical protein
VPVNPISAPASTAGVELQSTDCSSARSLKSISTAGSEKITLSFVNETKKPVTGYWIDFDGKTEKYFTLGANGESDDRTQVATYANHPWLIADQSGNCLAVFLPNGQSAEAKIIGK